MNFEIRKLSEKDYQRVFEIYLECRQSPLFLSKTVETVDDFLKLLEDEKCYILECQGVVTGFISVYPPQSFVHHLYIAKEFQGKGFGKALVDFAGNKFDNPLSLKCERINTEALNFYEKTGWKFFNEGSDFDGSGYILLTLNLD